MTLVTKLILIAPVAADWQSFVPINQEVWDHIFASDTTWGMKTIKIDHLYEAFWGHGAPPYAGGHPELLVRPTLIPVPAGRVPVPFRSGQEASVGLQSRVNAAHEFLGGIGEAAERHGVDIMWCMSFPK